MKTLLTTYIVWFVALIGEYAQGITEWSFVFFLTTQGNARDLNLISLWQKKIAGVICYLPVKMAVGVGPIE